jgi:3-dehydroquinate synthase
MMLIKSRLGDYSVDETPSLSDALKTVTAGRQTIFAIVDSRLADVGYATDLGALDSKRTFTVEATEEQKAFERLAPIFLSLLDAGFRRDSSLLAIGGGVIQDIVCFIASVLMRGVKWDFIPTTLLAQCDSCIGSKSSINIGRFKNQIGTFYPPSRVYLSRGVLQTLPPDEIRSGLGEAIKLHLLSGEEQFNQLHSELQNRELTEIDFLPMIWRCLKIKKHYIETDEFDRGIRNLLNYGHTFGHAYESASGYSIPHGIAVTLGVATATFISEQLGLAPQGHFIALNGFLNQLYAPYQHTLSKLDLEPIIAAMKRDKKNVGDEITCILTRGYGDMEKRALPVARAQELLSAFIQSVQ